LDPLRLGFGSTAAVAGHGRANYHQISEKWPFLAVFRWSGRQSDRDAPVRACTQGKRIAAYEQIHILTHWYNPVWYTSCELLISGLEVRVLPGSPNFRFCSFFSTN